MIWPEELIDRIASRKCVLFLGSGISANSTNAVGEHPATWYSFLEKANEEVKEPKLKKLIEKKIKGNEYLLAGQLLKNHLKDNFKTIIENEYRKKGFEVADIHKDIYEIDSKIVITPNFDEIYDTYAKTISHNTVVVKNYNDKDLLKYINSVSKERLIIKTHGTVDKLDDLIFSQSEYSEARVKNADFYEIVKALLLTHTFLFLGAGLSDPDIKLLLENNSYQFSSAKHHYFCIAKKEISNYEKEIFQKDMQITFLEYDTKDNRIEFFNSIKELIRLVKKKRDEMAGGLTW